MNRISKQLVAIAQNIKDDDPSSFDNFKKHIMDVCKNQINVFQQLNYFCQMNYDALKNIDVFDDIQQIGQLIEKMFNKAKMAKRIK